MESAMGLASRYDSFGRNQVAWQSDGDCFRGGQRVVRNAVPNMCANLRTNCSNP
jgi:hypothetical protein